MAKKIDDKKDHGKHGRDSDERRRALLKTAAAGGTVFSLTALPGKWAKPVVASVVLPAHAQFSQACCDLVPVENTSEPIVSTVVQASVTNGFPGISLDGTTLDGSGGASLFYPSTVPCPPGCDGVPRKYITLDVAFGDGSKYVHVEAYNLCGDSPIAHYEGGVSRCPCG